MAILQARSPLRSAHPLLLITNKLVSIALFIALLCAGWVGLSYLRNQLQSRRHQPVSAPAAAASAVPDVSADATQEKHAAAPMLVYFCQSDAGYYHASTHLERCKRTALSLDAAIARGLKRCPTCFPE